MVTPVQAWVSGQSSSNGLLQGPNGPLSLAAGFAVANGDLVVHNPKGLAQAV